MQKLIDNIQLELEAISEKGLTNSNLDTASRLIDMMKDIKNMEYWAEKEAKIEEDSPAAAALRAEMGDKALAHAEYLEYKKNYRDSKDAAEKQKMLSSLEKHMDSLAAEISDMSRDADCREEREMVRKYINKIQGMV